MHHRRSTTIPGAQQVTLGPGDLLYIPPLTFHHVETLEPSVSLNFWTDTPQSNAAQRMAEVAWPQLPDDLAVAAAAAALAPETVQVR